MKPQPNAKLAETPSAPPPLLEALVKLVETPEFQSFLSEGPSAQLDRLQKVLDNSADPIELYRAQGGKKELMRFLNVTKTIERLTKERYESAKQAEQAERGS